MKARTGREQFKDWMKRRGFNQRTAAEFLDWKEPIVSMLVNGRRKPGRQNAVYLEEKTGIPVSAW